MSYRSGLEDRFANYLERQNIPFLYECSKYPYVLHHKYTPDFILKNGVIIETKGFWKPSDRSKIKAVKQQHPELDLRMVFMRNNRLSKTSKTTYGMWCEKHNIPWAVFPHIPEDWFQ